MVKCIVLDCGILLLFVSDFYKSVILNDLMTPVVGIDKAFGCFVEMVPRCVLLKLLVTLFKFKGL